MIPRWLAVMVSLCMMAGACHPPVVEPEASLRSLRRLALTAGSDLPAGDLRLTAYVRRVGGSREGTWLEVSDTDGEGDVMLLLYGTAADAPLASWLQQQTVELEFRLTGRVTLEGGREALRIDIRGMRVTESPGKNEVP